MICRVSATVYEIIQHYVYAHTVGSLKSCILQNTHVILGSIFWSSV